MWDACVGGEEVVVECVAGVDAGELAGLGDGDEELLAGRGMDDEVVDGLVDDGALAFVGGEGCVNVWCCGEHFEDGLGVGDREVFALTHIQMLALCCRLE